MAGSGKKAPKSGSSLRQSPVRIALITMLGTSLTACTALSTDPAKLPEGQDFVSWVPRNYSNQPFPVIQSKDGKPVVDPKEQIKETDRLPRPTQTWWLEFGNEELGELVETALANNYDLRVAVARIEQAERQALVANSSRYPEINFFVTRSMEGPAGGLGTATSRSTFQHKNEYSFGFRASYEVDLWGKIGYQAESALAQARASIFNRQAVALTLTSEVTTAYLQILSLNERIEISEKNIEIANQVADALSKRVEQGDSTVLDLQRQQVTIALLQNVQANLRLQRERLINRLAVLLGKPPNAVKIQGKSLKGVKVPMVTPGLPSELLCRRPDIRRSEAQLAAASADVNAARANLLPSVTLTAEYGQGSQHLSDLLRPQSLLYNAAANLIQNIFDAEKRENQLAAARARNRELLDTYANTVLSALRDVEDALAGIRLTGMQQEALAEALARNNRLLELSRTIFDRGALEYIALLDTQRDVFQAQDSEANARFEQVRAAVDLFKALGGGIAPENDPCVTDPKANLLVDPRGAQKATQDKPAEIKPAEVKPAEVKPVEAKPEETKPAAEVKPDDAALKAKAEEEARIKAEQEAAAAKAKAEEDARLAAEAEAKAKADAEAKARAEAEAKAAEEARVKAEQEAAAAKAKADAEAKAAEEARVKAEQEAAAAKAKAEEDARLAAEAEAKAKADAEAKARADAEAKAAEEARVKAEQEAAAKAKADAEAKAAEEARVKAEQEAAAAKAKAEEEARIAAEAKARAEAEAKATEEARVKAEQEAAAAKAKAEEEARLSAEAKARAEAEAKAAEEARLKAEQEKSFQAQLEEAARKAEAEAKALIEQQTKLRAEEEAARAARMKAEQDAAAAAVNTAPVPETPAQPAPEVSPAPGVTVTPTDSAKIEPPLSLENVTSPTTSPADATPAAPATAPAPSGTTTSPSN